MPEKFGYIINRLISFINPSMGDKFQSSSALDAIKLGGLKGQGIGEGILKDSVPEAHTDYIISIISEEYGSIISVMIIAIFLYISFRIIKNCIKQDDQFNKNFSLRTICLINISNLYSCWREYKPITNNWNDTTIFKLWRLFFNWKCNTCRCNT